MKSDPTINFESLFFFFYFKLIKKKTYHLTKRGKCYIIIDACNDAYTIKYRKNKNLHMWESDCIAHKPHHTDK